MLKTSECIHTATLVNSYNGSMASQIRPLYSSRSIKNCSSNSSSSDGQNSMLIYDIDPVSSDGPQVVLLDVGG